MNELKDPAKKKKKKDKGKLQLIHQGVNTKNYNQGSVLHLCITTTAAAATTTKQQTSFGFINARFTILHGLSPKYRNKLLLKGETLTLKPERRTKNILQTVPAIVKYDYFV